MSATSACVGFWPSARRISPRVSLGTAPVPFLSKSAKASLYSAPRFVNRDDLNVNKLVYLSYRSPFDS